MSSTKKLTKADALAAIERNDQANAELRAFIESLDANPSATVPPIAVRFKSENGEEGVILRFPTEVTLATYAEELNVTEKQLRTWPGTEFLTRLFVARGGQVYDAEFRIEEWNKLRWPSDVSLADALQGVDSAEGVKRAWRDLEEQPTVGELLGCTETYFLSLEQNLTGATGSFFDHLAAGRTLPDPLAFLAVCLTVDDITNPETYPSRIGWEWIGALHPEGYAADASADSDGLDLGWARPGTFETMDRARSALRSA